MAETHQTLVLNGLRSRVALQVDGGLRTGRDVIVGALLGADEFGFSTAPLIAAGCLMMRKCHLNTCPVGIATQDPVLRKRFKGTPEHVINYFFFVAEEVREFLAAMGFAKLDDIIGQSDMLARQEMIDHWKARGLDFSRIFFKPDAPKAGDPLHRAAEASDRRRARPPADRAGRAGAGDAPAGGDRDADPQYRPFHRRDAVGRGRQAVRPKGAARRHDRRAGSPARPDSRSAPSWRTAFHSNSSATATTMSARAFRADASSSGRPTTRAPSPENSIIVGNTVLYGAIEGECYFRGVAGERFAVRNSGAVTVVEGVGDHGCEYMTGGVVVVLGQTGRNFAAGMSGGVAYVLDEDGDFAEHCNMAMVELEPVPEEDDMLERLHHHGGDLAHKGRVDVSGDMTRHDEERLVQLISNHVHYTGSTRGRTILDNWADYRSKFRKVMPVEYRRALQEMERMRMGIAAE